MSLWVVYCISKPGWSNDCFIFPNKKKALEFISMKGYSKKDFYPLRHKLGDLKENDCFLEKQEYYCDTSCPSPSM